MHVNEDCGQTGEQVQARSRWYRMHRHSLYKSFTGVKYCLMPGQWLWKDVFYLLLETYSQKAFQHLQSCKFLKGFKRNENTKMSNNKLHFMSMHVHPCILSCDFVVSWGFFVMDATRFQRMSFFYMRNV